jgi:hypothetical protein
MGQCRKNLRDLDRNGSVGDWCFQNEDTLIVLRYGEDKFKDVVILPIGGDRTPQWTWDGDKEFPTLSPSILVSDRPGWAKGFHGYLTRGELISC